MTIDFKDRESNLSPRELSLWKRIKPRSGVPMLIGIPGIAKSATTRSIAEKLGLQYIDFRLSTVDETDLGIFPIKKECTEGDKSYCIITQGVPEWAIDANQKPTLIHFEELNRCSSNIRNAALGILLERRIGTHFQFNDNVYFISSGNPTSNFDNDVYQLGSALIGRLIPIKYHLSYQEWKDDFAVPNKVNKWVMSFLDAETQWCGNDPEWSQLNIIMKVVADSASPVQYPSFRSWTFLSDYLNSLEPEEANSAALTVDIVTSYVGQTVAIKFVKFVEDRMKFNIDSIINGKMGANHKLTGTEVQELINEFNEKYTDFEKLTDEQINNFKKFFVNMVSDEQKVAFLTDFIFGDKVKLDKEPVDQQSNTKKFVLAHKEWLNLAVDSKPKEEPKEEEKTVADEVDDLINGLDSVSETVTDEEENDEE